MPHAGLANQGAKKNQIPSLGPSFAQGHITAKLEWPLEGGTGNWYQKVL